MTPLDLTIAPPRSAWVMLDGLIMIARTIDKMRARLDGGRIGDYQIAGMSIRLLDAIEVSERQLQEVVLRAASDADVCRWLRVNANVKAYEAVNRSLAERRLTDVDINAMHRRYPFAKKLPMDARVLDILDRDDAISFPSVRL